MLLANLPAELPNCDNLAYARGCRSDEVEHLCQRAHPCHQWDLELKREVLLERRLGIHRHGPELRCDLSFLESRGRGLVEVGEVALGVDFAYEGALAPVCTQPCERRRDGRLADSALSGDEYQLP